MTGTPADRRRWIALYVLRAALGAREASARASAEA
jgi:hypothetical protein